MFGIDPDTVDVIVKSGGMALFLSICGNMAQWRYNIAERKRTDAAVTERKEIAKKYQDHLEDYNDKTDGNIKVIQSVGHVLEKNTKLLEGFKCQYLTK